MTTTAPLRIQVRLNSCCQFEPRKGRQRLSDLIVYSSARDVTIIKACKVLASEYLQEIRVREAAVSGTLCIAELEPSTEIRLNCMCNKGDRQRLLGTVTSRTHLRFPDVLHVVKTIKNMWR